MVTAAPQKLRAGGGEGWAVGLATTGANLAWATMAGQEVSPRNAAFNSLNRQLCGILWFVAHLDIVRGSNSQTIHTTK